jgi:hypothetical protein
MDGHDDVSCDVSLSLTYGKLSQSHSIKIKCLNFCQYVFVYITNIFALSNIKRPVLFSSGTREWITLMY